ncbi:hypothetical protein CDV31_016585 [Fusarium ambrosium]|uniref:NAD(P)-binding domain-containing protein n=1 Tax=Fusarium ambrosium TaxID=131363 RepID=A0A428S653_9HYPO|nr:hypothetical protein CDV31_016585 [Fusarium ambrosium]
MAYTVLITGANRGIGKDLLKLYLNLPQTTTIAAVRSLTHPSVDEIRNLPVASGSELIVVKIDSDTVIANAGIGKDWSLVAQTAIDEVEDHFKINSVGPFALYLAMRPLLLASADPKFVVLSTELGSIGLQGERKIQDVAYAKADCISHSPRGRRWVKTTLGNAIAETLGMREAPTTQEQSAAGIFDQVEKSTKAETSGRFITFEGKDIPW